MAARAVTEARIGPAQGAHTNPRLTPVRKPGQKPLPCLGSLLAMRGMKLRARSTHRLNFGTIMLNPSKPITLTAMMRRVCAERPSRRTICEIARVKMEKLMISPVMTPNGRRLPLAAELDNTMGRTGSTQGDNTVTMPESNENKISSNISSPLNYLYLLL